MSEIIPPSEPEKEPPKLFSTRNDDVKEPPGKGLCAFIGFLLLLFTGAFGFLNPLFLVVGLVAAFASLFFDGYRYIFLGYILTLLIGAGLAVLVLIMICGNIRM